MRVSELVVAADRRVIEQSSLGEESALRGRRTAETAPTAGSRPAPVLLGEEVGGAVALGKRHVPVAPLPPRLWNACVMFCNPDHWMICASRPLRRP